MWDQFVFASVTIATCHCLHWRHVDIMLMTENQTVGLYGITESVVNESILI